MRSHNVSTTVFIIDDDPEICHSLKWLLESAKLTVEVFTCPLRFLEKFEYNEAGCIISDVYMPLMNGLQLTTELRLRKNTSPIIMISALNDTPIVIQAFKAGANDFIPKPFKDLSFIDDIKKTITKKNDKAIDLDLTPDMIENSFLKNELKFYQSEYQNLLNAQFDLEAMLTKYANFINDMPIACFNLNKNGLIAGVNHAGSSLLGLNKTQLLNRCFIQFVAKDFQLIFSQYRQYAQKKLLPASCIIKLLKQDASSLLVYCYCKIVKKIDNGPDELLITCIHLDNIYHAS